MTTRGELIAAMQATAAQKPVKVEVKGWPTVWVRQVTVEEIESYTEDMSDKKNKQRIARGAARVICDENGGLLFDPDDDDDVALLAKQPWALLRKISAANEEDEKN